jgi:hypothetical protein
MFLHANSASSDAVIQQQRELAKQKVSTFHESSMMTSATREDNDNEDKMGDVIDDMFGTSSNHYDDSYMPQQQPITDGSQISNVPKLNSEQMDLSVQQANGQDATGRSSRLGSYVTTPDEERSPAVAALRSSTVDMATCYCLDANLTPRSSTSPLLASPCHSPRMSCMRQSGAITVGCSSMDDIPSLIRVMSLAPPAGSQHHDYSSLLMSNSQMLLNDGLKCADESLKSEPLTFDFSSAAAPFSEDCLLQGDGTITSSEAANCNVSSNPASSGSWI